MSSPLPRLLLLEDSAIEAEHLLGYLAVAFDIVHVTSVKDATARLAAEPFDVALIDLCVDDSRNLPTFLACHAVAPHVPFVVQSGVDDVKNEFGDWPLCNQQMASALKFAGYDVRFDFGEGAHNSKHGGSIFPEVLKWLWRDGAK